VYVVGFATLGKGFLAESVFHIVPASFEKAIQALVYKFAQRGVVGRFQKVVYGLQNIKVYVVARQYAIIGDEYTALAFLLIVFAPIGLGDIQIVPMVIDKVFEKPYSFQIVFFLAVMRGKTIVVGAAVV